MENDKHDEQPKDTTSEWIQKLSNLHPKQGEITEVADVAPKAVFKDEFIEKEKSDKLFEIRNGVGIWVYFDRDANIIGEEKVPG